MGSRSNAPRLAPLLPAAVDFGPGPASIPFESEMAVLEVSPRDGGLFTIRVRTERPWVVQPVDDAH